MALFARTKNWSTNEVLTEPDLEGEFDNIINNMIPTMVEDYSTDSTAMQVQTDPYPASSVSLATSLAGEIERIRYQLAQLLGTTYWYDDVTKRDMNYNVSIVTGSASTSSTTLVRAGIARATITTEGHPVLIVGTMPAYKTGTNDKAHVFIAEDGAKITGTNRVVEASNVGLVYHNFCLVKTTTAATYNYDFYWNVDNASDTIAVDDDIGGDYAQSISVMELKVGNFT